MLLNRTSLSALSSDLAPVQTKANSKSRYRRFIRFIPSRLVVCIPQKHVGSEGLCRQLDANKRFTLPRRLWYGKDNCCALGMIVHSRVGVLTDLPFVLFLFSFQWKDLLPLRPTPTIKISKPLMETPKCATLRLDSSCDWTRGPPHHSTSKNPPCLFLFVFFFF